jgi:hypothetical protein
VAGCCECGDEPLGSCATELVSLSSFPTSDISLFPHFAVIRIKFMNYRPIESSCKTDRE